MADVTDEGEDVEPQWAYSPTPIPSSITERAARNQTNLVLRMRFVSLKDGLCYWSSRARLGTASKALQHDSSAVRPPRSEVQARQLVLGDCGTSRAARAG